MSAFEKNYDQILLGGWPSYLQCICMNHDKSSVIDIIPRKTCQVNTLLGIHFYGKIMISYLSLQGGEDYLSKASSRAVQHNLLLYRIQNLQSTQTWDSDQIEEQEENVLKSYNS